MADRRGPSEAQIRRALAECMTVEDIDDAMGWPRGTARRRRWQAPERGGLPFADAELGGVALWFRSTFEAWQRTPAARAGRRRVRRAPAADDGTVQPPAVHPEPDPQSRGDEPDEQDEPAVAHPPTTEDTDRELDDEPDEAPDDETESSDTATAGTGRWQPAGVRVHSGYELAVGQQVLAEVQGRWRQVEVSRRDRTSVLVQYRLDDSLLGARVQRVGVDRVLVPHGEQPGS